MEELVNLCDTCIYEDFGHCLADQYGARPDTEVDYESNQIKVIRCTRFFDSKSVIGMPMA